MLVMRWARGALGGLEPGTSSEKPRGKSETFIWTFRARDTGTRRSRYEILWFPSIRAGRNEISRFCPSLCFPIKNAYSAIPRRRSEPGTGLSGIGARIL